MFQAEKACKEWADKGFTYTYEYLPLSSDVLFPWEKKSLVPGTISLKSKNSLKVLEISGGALKKKRLINFLDTKYLV